ncbi:SurA N-terminal domain-containing protein [Streptomyces crystallinus]|uniref:SurA N-terminal domain-containing protein n=1 Tax=Streptomyces crystallinus TaxID=68191 RepID=A0ABP3QLM2_9ACTN
MHRRRRTALALCVALLGAGPLLTACGSEAHPGAAAVVGGDRIPVSALQAQVKDVRTAQQASPQSAQLIKNTGQLSRAKLHGLIFDKVLDRAAADAGVSVSRKELQEARAAMARQSGGEQAFAAMLLQQRGVAPDQIDDAVREQVQLTKLAAATGADLSTPPGQAAVTKTLTEASKKLKIDVNPRYGSWDDKAIQLADTKTPWIAQVTKNAPDEQTPVTG